MSHEREAIELGKTLEGVVTWTDEKRNALAHLHSAARSEARGAGPRVRSGPWRDLERRLFGDPGRLMSINEENGQGLSASLINGTAVGVFALAGIEETDELSDRLWGTHNWRSVLDSCPAAEVMEVGEHDDVPGMSDVYFWVRISEPDECARQLRELILRLT